MAQNEFREILQRLCKTWIPGSVVGQITAVDGTDTCTVEPVDGGATLYKVRLRATIDGNDEGVVSIPAVDSFVIVSPINHNDNQLFVSRFSKVESWHVKTENSTSLQVNDDGTVFLNGNNFGSLIKIDDIVDRLNSIEDAISGLVDDHNSHIHDVIDPVSGTLVADPPTVPSTQNAGTTTVSAIENDKVQHGG
jgi:hypothetical protein